MSIDTVTNVDLDELSKRFRTKSAMIRHLHTLGLKTAEIARILDIRYQFAYNVIQRSLPPEKEKVPEYFPQSRTSMPPVHGSPTREDAEAAVRTLIAWVGESPTRKGLLRTPYRVTSSLEDLCDGYTADPLAAMERTFPASDTNHDMVSMRNICVQSMCEHHMLPFVGFAHVAYVPSDKLVGLSKIARVVEILSRRLQTQENLTRQILDTMEKALSPKGVAVHIDAEHDCMKLRGVKMTDARTSTTCFSGIFSNDDALKARFFAANHQH